MIINYEIIINELLLLCEDFNQKGIFEKDYIQLFKQRILLSKYKNEVEFFNYLLNNKDKEQNMVLLAKFYRYGIGTEKSRALKHLNALKQQLKKIRLIQYINLVIIIKME